MRHYPVEPLLQLSGMGKAALQRHLKVAGREWVRYWSEGMSPRVADRAATCCGYHPALVWPSWFDDALEDHGRDCACCGERFLPGRYAGSERQRFCSTRCRRLEGNRRRRRRPEVAEANRAARRAYYRENAEYERSQQRRRSARKAA